MNCPKCGSEKTTAVVDGMARCHDCENYFAPPPAPPTPEVMVQPVMIYELPEVRRRREELHKLAASHIRSSWACNAIGVILLFLGIVGQSGWFAGAAGFFFMCGIVSYIVGQLIHIRANTEK